MNNYLDSIPVQNISFIYEKGMITLIAENKGILYRILRRPKLSYIHLDGFGSYIWQLIDGKNSIADMGNTVKEHFGNQAEPLYPRLIQFIKTLKEYKFIKLNKPTV